MDVRKMPPHAAKWFIGAMIGLGTSMVLLVLSMLFMDMPAVRIGLMAAAFCDLIFGSVCFYKFWRISQSA
ncbi:MAG: hypothetical protein MH204_11480 [Fimbriimonadaceae bacterium]|nr:hypothetical protein [Fimbriimonadaceae bacterium]